MMTPQEVAASTFPKATLGGYNMAAVDVFLDKLTEDYTTLYKENATLKAKIKTLVDKMEEYHAMEETMRSTLLTAQKMATNMINEAEEKRATLISDAEADARVRMRELVADVAAEERRLAAVHEDIDRQIALEQERLVVAQRELAAFVNGAKALCTRQMEMLERLNELDILPEGFKLSNESEQKLPELESLPVDNDIPAEQVEDGTPAADSAAEPVAEVPDSDASALVETMRSVIDLFASEGIEGAKIAENGASAKDEVGDPFAIDFENAGDLFEKKDETSVGDPFAQSEEDSYDNFDNENQDSTRVLNLDDLQFGRNYNKD